MEKEKQIGLPSWENFDFTPYAKEWKFFSVDERGKGFLSTFKPENTEDKSIYNNIGLGTTLYVGHFDPTNWQNSLQERKD